MHKTIYNNNLTELMGKYPDIYKSILSDKDKTEEDKYVMIDKSLNNEAIVKITNNSREYYLNSRYCDLEVSDIWIKQFEDIYYKDIFIIFGLSNFSVIKKLQERLGDENIVLLYEPDKNIFLKVIKNIDIVKIIKDKRFLLCINEMNSILADYFINFIISYSNIKRINYFCMHNYEEIYGVQSKRLYDAIKTKIENLIINRNTEIQLKDKFLENMFFVHEDISNQYLLNQLLTEFRNINKNRNIPAIIVSAGPSLDKNIEELKKAKGKSFIIVVDSALKSSYLHGIKPDIIITVDPEKDAILFMNTAFFDSPMIVHAKSNKEILNIHNGKRFYFDDPGSYISLLVESVVGEKIWGIETGGSVANNAFGLAHILGFKKIILIGQDLAYTDKKIHATEAYGGDKVEKSIYENDLNKVKDIFGNDVLAPPDMEIYRKWFENQIVQYPYLEVVDATEGGARIEGTKIMTLNEAIETYCVEIFDADIVINAIKPMFNNEEREKLRNRIDRLSLELDKERKKIEQGIRKYERIDNLFRLNKINNEFKNLINEVGELSVYIDNSPSLKMVSMYNKASEYEVLVNAYNTKQNQVEEIKEIIDNGKKILNSYISGIKELKSDIYKNKNLDKEALNNMLDLLTELIDDVIEKKEWNTFLKEFYNVYLKVYFIVKNHKENIESYGVIDKEMISVLTEILNKLEVNNIEEAKQVIKTKVANILNFIKNNQI